MKTKTLKIIFAVTLFCSLQASVALPHPTDSFDSNPLLLNGNVIGTAEFARVTRGVITLAKSDPASKQRTLVPFLIYLKRDGKIVNGSAYAHNHAVMRYEIAEVLKSAQAGDQLIIDPSEPNKVIGRQVITIKSTQIVPQFEWFFGLNKKKDNC
ncbi:hypothetical protein LZD49_22655 [Dyadobacter sp. CY261]|uniref:hypothetical protein n=1 Tax=Dyadobacter sp. CY261 TaxID=2907203 RepID=UPI001F1A4EFE|nr:hypothetical protein [Dyadobacter sp. CY261]MCF0073297.1 hypothetical protein [Dyadobacter sp. CY261]